MKLVGVTGRSGAGKTTFTDSMAENKNVGIIHIDDLVAVAKKKYFKMFLQPSEKNTTENTKANPKLNSNVKRIFYENKLLFKFLMAVRSRLVKKPLNDEVARLKAEGKRVIVIDDWAISTHKDLYPRLNKVYFMERKFSSRRRSLRLRDDLTREEIKISDIPYALRFLKNLNDEKTVVVRNTGTLEDLRIRAREEYERLGEQTFDERYSVNLESKADLTNSISKGINKIKDVRERSIEDRIN